MSTSTKRWYVIHTLTGSEKKAKALLEKSIEQSGQKDISVEEAFGRVLVPEGSSTRDGGQTRSIVLYPGYLFIEVDLNPKTESIIRQTSRISSINKNYLSQKEVSELLGEEADSEEKEIIEINCKVGDSVEIVEGPFKTMTATVEEVLHSSRKLKVTVMMFGRSNSVDLDFKQVKVI
jgi:transcriptional antiterminator NusG